MGGRRSPETLQAVERLWAQPAEHGDGQRASEGLLLVRGSSRRLRDPRVTPPGSHLVLPLPPPRLFRDLGSSQRGSPRERWGSPWNPAICLAGTLLGSTAAERCVLSSPLLLGERERPLTPPAALPRAVGCPSASRSPQPKPRLKVKGPLCELPSGTRPKESDRGLPCVSSDTTPDPVRLSPPPPCRREPVTCPSGKERGQLWLVGRLRSRWVTKERLSYPGSCEGEGAALGKKKTQICSP